MCPRRKGYYFYYFSFSFIFSFSSTDNVDTQMCKSACDDYYALWCMSYVNLTDICLLYRVLVLTGSVYIYIFFYMYFLFFFFSQCDFTYLVLFCQWGWWGGRVVRVMEIGDEEQVRETVCSCGIACNPVLIQAYVTHAIMHPYVDILTKEITEKKNKAV